MKRVLALSLCGIAHIISFICMVPEQKRIIVNYNFKKLLDIISNMPTRLMVFIERV